MATLVRDEKGTSALEIALLTPLLILIVVGGFEIWRLMMLRRALYIGAYQSARYLSNYVHAPSMPNWEREERAKWFILEELKGTHLYTDQLLSDRVKVRVVFNPQRCVDINPSFECGGHQVRVEATLRMPIRIPLLDYRSPEILLRGVINHNPCRVCG